MFTTMAKLHEHKTACSSKDNVKCGKCEEKFFSFKERLKHMQEKHETVKLKKCAFCSKTFLKQSNLEAHYNSHKHDSSNSNVSNLHSTSSTVTNVMSELDVIAADKDPLEL